VTFSTAWAGLDPAARRSLELAYASLAAGGLPVGAVLVDAGGEIVAEGRNRAYDPPGGEEVLQGTPLAHAELNVLAAVRTGRDLADCTLWSSQQPCSMCAAAAAFTGVGTVRYVAPDPWAIAARPDPGVEAARSVPLGDDLWVVVANLLFLVGVASAAGVDSPTVAGNREREPETARLAVELVEQGTTAAALTAGRPLPEVLESLWPRISAAAADRRKRG
jgi:tRNA(Arg) A34 adenosine deaminase TadA